jgi:hypothetical protein
VRQTHPYCQGFLSPWQPFLLRTVQHFLPPLLLRWLPWLVLQQRLPQRRRQLQ